MLSRSQKEIINSIICYLKKYANDRDVKQSEFLLSEMTRGYCCGFTSLWLYACTLENTPPSDKERDDLEWFDSTCAEILGWDKVSDLSSQQQATFERFINLIEYFQHIEKYFSIGQGDFHYALADTKNSRYLLQYTLGSCYTQVEAADVLQKMLDENMFASGYTLISSFNHATGLYKSKDGKYYYYDPNNANGKVVVNNGKDLAECIFASNRFDPAQSSPIGLRIFGSSPLEKTLSQVEIIKNLSAVRQIGAADSPNTGCLYMATRVGDEVSASYYLEQGADCNSRIETYSSPLEIGIDRVRNQLVQNYLQKPGTVVTKKAFKLAVSSRNHEILELLFSKVVYPFNDIIDLLEIAINNNDSETVSILLENGANNFVEESNSYKYIELAVKQANLDMIDSMLKCYNGSYPYNVIALLHQVVSKGQHLTAQVFINNGVNVNVRNDRDETPLHIALELGEIDAAEVLAKDNKIDFSVVNNNRKTLLNSAYIGLSKLKTQLELSHSDAIRAKRIANEIARMHSLIIILLKSNAINLIDAYHYAIAKSTPDEIAFLAEIDDTVIMSGKALIIAAKHDRMSMASAFIKQFQTGVNISVDHQTPLQIAATNNNIEMMKLLLDNGADPNGDPDCYCSPLFAAASAGYVAGLKLLVERGADTSMGHRDGETILSAAVRGNQYDAVAYLVKFSKNELSTVLRKIIAFANPKIVRLLLDSGADPLDPDTSGLTVLQLAVNVSKQRNSFASIHENILLMFDKVIDDRNNKSTRLHLAVEYGLVDLVVILLRDIYVNQEALNNNHESPLHIAAKSGNPEITALLLRKALIYSSSPSYINDPAMIAQEAGHYLVAYMILDKYKDPVAYAVKHNFNFEHVISKLLVTKNHDIKDLQMVALRNQNISLTINLLSHECNKLKVKSKPQAMLVIAISRGYGADAIREILRLNPELSDQINSKDLAPLHVALEQGRIEEANVLFRIPGINLQLVRNDDGKSLLHIACERGLNDIVQNLLPSTADINACDRNNRSALYFACASGNERLVDMLLDDPVHGKKLNVYDQCEALLYAARNNSYISDRLRVRSYIDYRSRGGLFTGYKIGRSKPQKMAAAGALEQMVKAKSFNDKLFDKHKSDYRQGSLKKVVNSLELLQCKA